MRRPLLAAVATTAVFTAGCSSIGGSAIRTGTVRLPPNAGPTNIYLSGAPAGATELGRVEVHASESQANVETLLPIFVAKVAALGGNAAVLDVAPTRFEFVTRVIVETFSYSCGFNLTCIGSRPVPVSSEMMTLSLRGRAMHQPAVPR